LDDLFEGDEFQIEARAAYTGVALVVSMMYSTGMPLLTIFAFFNFSLSFAVDKWLLIKKYAQPPMYGAAVPKVLVNLLPIGTFIHMAVGLYMLANKQILYGPDLTRTAEDRTEPASRSSEILELLMPRLVRMHTLCLFLIFCAYAGLFVLYGFGLLDEFAEECGIWADKLYARCCGSKLAKQAAAARALNHPEPPRPAYTDPYIANLTIAQKQKFKDTGKLSKSDRRRGFKLIDKEGEVLKKIHIKDTEVNGVKRKKGDPKFTWEHIKDTTSYTYDIGLNRKYKAALNGIKSNHLPNPSRKLRLEDADKEDRYAITLENMASLTEYVYDTEEEEEKEEEGEGGAEGGEEQLQKGGEGETGGEGDGTLAIENEGKEEMSPNTKDDTDPSKAPADEDGQEVKSEEQVEIQENEDTNVEVASEEVEGNEEVMEPEPEPEPEMSEEEIAAAKAQEELLAKLAAEEAEMLAKLAEEEAARQAEEEAAAAKLAEEEAARAALEAEAAAKAAEEEAARQAADAAAKARAEEEAEYARQKALAKEEAEKQAALEAAEAERLREEAEAAENMVIEVDDDAEEL